MKPIMDLLKPFLATLAVLIGASVGWYVFLYRPDLSKSQALKEQTEELMMQLQSLRVTDVQVSTLQTQIEKLQLELAKTTARVRPKDDLPKLIAEIKARGAAHGLTFVSIIPEYNALVQQPENQDAEIIKLIVHFQIRGYYKNFGRFIETLAALPFFVSLGDFSLIYEESVFPQVLINVDLALFLSQTPAEKDQKSWQS